MAALLSGCKRLDTLPYSPLVTPAQFLRDQHWVRVNLCGHAFIWSQPISSFIVFFVSFYAMYTGYRLFRALPLSYAKRFWGIGLMLTGMGAFFAGISFQALGYEIKCSDREYCTLTSWYEVIYMLLSVPGMNAFLLAGVYSSTTGALRKVIGYYACLHTILYTIALLYGAFYPDAWLVSFEFFTLVSAPSVLFLIGLHAYRYMRSKHNKERTLLITWVIFVHVTLLYATYLCLGITQRLWASGIWFTENDLLHTGMIAWIYYISNRLSPTLDDYAPL
jgi:hypothetical protein